MVPPDPSAQAGVAGTPLRPCSRSQYVLPMLWELRQHMREVEVLEVSWVPPCVQRSPHFIIPTALGAAQPAEWRLRWDQR